MLNLSPESKYPFSSKGIQVKSLRFIPSSGSNYISVFAQYGNCGTWVPLQIGLSSIPSLQQVRDVDRNISLNTGSYQDAHFYLRSADGNNINTAFFTNKDGGGIQSGATTGYTALNLQSLGGLLNYGGNEVATKIWTQGQGYLQTETDPTVPSYVKSITPADIANWNGKENAANKSTSTILGTSDVLFPTQKAVKTYVDAAISTSVSNYIPLSQKGAVNGVASLGADGKIPNGQIPAIAITNTFVVASQAAMLALSTAETGDIAVRTDINESFILTNNVPGTLSSWQQLLNPTITSTDQVPEGSSNLYFTTARARASISVTGNGSYNSGTGVITINAGNAGTVTQVSSGNLSPLFNTVISNATTTPAISFTAITQAAKAFYAAPNATSGVPVFRSILPSDLGTGVPTAGTFLNGTGVWSAETDPVYTAAIPSILMVKTTIPTAADLNTYQITGIYLQPTNANAAAGANYPVPFAGKLEVVFALATMMWQTYHVYGDATASNRAIWRREYYAGAWTPWVKLIDATAASAYELIANKATSFSTVNNTVYPTVQAVSNQFVKTVGISRFALSNNPNLNLFDTSPITSNGLGDMLAFKTPLLTETSTDFAVTWGTVPNGTFMGLLSQKTKWISGISTALVNTAGSLNGIRITFQAMANMFPSWFKLVSGFSSLGCQIDILMETSLDNITYTSVSNQTGIPNNIGGTWVNIQNAFPNGNQYIRFTFTINSSAAAGASHPISQIQLLTYRLDFGIGAENRMPFDWTADRYLRIQAPTYSGSGPMPSNYKLALIDTSNGNQITMTDLGSALNGNFIQNQTASTQASAGFRIDGAGQVANFAIGGSLSPSFAKFYNNAPLTGAASMTANYTLVTIQPDVTSTATLYDTNYSTAAASFTLGTLAHYRAIQGNIGAGSNISGQIGFYATNSLVGATNNYGFRGLVPFGTSNWNLYMDGSAWNYLAGNLGIGATALTNTSLRVSKSITGSVGAYGIISDGVIQSDVTTQAAYFRSAAATISASFTLSNLAHFNAVQAAFGSGSTVAIQTGFEVSNTMTGATNNYGFFGNLAAATGRWNIYMAGTAFNYLAGRLGIGVTSVGNVNVSNYLGITGAVTAYGMYTPAIIQSDVTNTAVYYGTSAQTVASAFTVASLQHFAASQGTIGVGSTITQQVGFLANNSLVGASINHGFRGTIPAAASNWNAYMDGTAQNYFRGNTAIGVTTTSTSPLYVDMGTLGSLNPISIFAQNGGTIQIANGTSTSGQFIPTIRGVASVSNNSGMFIVGQGADSYSQGAIVLRGANTGYTGAVTSGKLFSLQNYTTDYLSVSYNGIVNIPNLVGAAPANFRAVIADGSGNLTIRSMNQMTYQSAIDFDTLKIVGEYAFINNTTAINGAPQTTGSTYYYGYGGGDVGGRGVQMAITSDSNFYFRVINSPTAPVSSVGWVKAASETYVTTNAILNQSSIIQSANARIGGYMQGLRFYAGGGTPISNVSFYSDADMTGNTTVHSFRTAATIQSSVTATAYGYSSNLSTAASTFSLASLLHFQAAQGTFGAGSTVSQQVGFYAGATMIGATTNYGFRGVIPVGTNNWNIYMDGTAPNYMAGKLGIGSTAVSNVNLRNSVQMTGNVTQYGFFLDPTVASDVTGNVFGYVSTPALAAAAFTLSVLTHFQAQQNTIGSGSAISLQRGYAVSSNLIGAVTNQAFFGDIPAATGRWNLYMNGSANNYLSGSLFIGATNPNGWIASLVDSKSMTGGASVYGIVKDSTVQSDVTDTAGYFRSQATIGTGVNLSVLSHYIAGQNTIAGGSTVTNQHGFFVNNSLIGATVNIGFRGSIPIGINRYNLYMDGTAQNWLAGYTAIGNVTVPTSPLHVSVGATALTVPIARFDQSGGSIQLMNGTTSSTIFVPYLKGIVIGNTVTGLGLIAQGSDTYSSAGISLSARNTAGTGTITGGNTFQVLNYTTAQFSIDYAGNVIINSLAGSGTRSLTVSSTGVVGFSALTSGTVTSVSGTSNRITVTSGTTTPVIDIASTYTGQTSITTLGTITSGTWNGTTISVANGGTGVSTLTGIIIGNGTTAMTGVAGIANQLLRRNAANTAYEFFTPTYLTSAPNLQAVATAGNAFTGDLILGTTGNEVNIGSGPAGTGNTRMGTGALSSNTAGDWNTAIGSNALGAMVESSNNTAIGEGAMFAYTGIGDFGGNTAIGDAAGANMTLGTDNTFLGNAAGVVGTTPMPRGNLNIFIGRSAGNSFGVSSSVSLGSSNIFIGSNAGYGPSWAPLSNQLLIGNNPIPGTSTHIIEGDMTPGASSLKFNTTTTTTIGDFHVGGIAYNDTLMPFSGNNINLGDASSNVILQGTTILENVLAGGLLKTDVTGKLTSAIAGSDYLTSNEVSSGAYTPSFTLTPTGTATAIGGFLFIKVGNMVQVSGGVSCSGLSIGTSKLLLSLPVPSNFTNISAVMGVVSGTAINSSLPNYVMGDVSTHRALVNFSTSSASAIVYFQFQYLIS